MSDEVQHTYHATTAPCGCSFDPNTFSWMIVQHCPEGARLLSECTGWPTASFTDSPYEYDQHVNAAREAARQLATQ